MAGRVPHGGPAIPMNKSIRMNSLAFRIAGPVLVVCLLAGVGLYLAMQRTVTQFSERQIGQIMAAMAANAYLICDATGNRNGLTAASMPLDAKELRIRKALTIGSLETFFRQNGLVGFLVTEGRRISLNRELAPDLQAVLEQSAAGREVALLTHGGEDYAAVGAAFPPWNWHIVLAKKRTAFAALAQDVRWLYASVVFLIAVGYAVLMLALEEMVRKPIRAIIDTVRKGGRPASTGVGEFDYLADQLQTSIQRRNTLMVNMERTHFLYSHDIHGKFTYVSPSIADILGYQPEEFLTSYATYLTDHPVNRDAARRTTLSIQGQQQPPYEVEIYHRDGSRRWLSVTEIPIVGDDGSVAAVEGIARDITESKRVERDRERLIGELQAALAEIKTLQGIIPICASCKKVRDDEGAWQQVESYIAAHSNAQFSHGICPDCFRQLYPDFTEPRKDDR